MAVTPPGTDQLALDFAWDERLGLESFVTGPNRQVLAAVEQVAGGAGERYVYLYGPPGQGKTHLLQGACRAASAAGRAAAYLPLWEAVRWPVEALEGLESLGLVAVDDLEAVAGSRAWQEALFHLFNRVRDGGGQLVMAARVRPPELGLVLPDLVSRLQWGLCLRLEELDDADKQQLLTARAAQRGLELSDEVARYLLVHYRRDLSGLLEALDRLDAASLAAQRRLTVPFLKTVLEV